VQPVEMTKKFVRAADKMKYHTASG
jgi:hypothetical protein